MEEVAANVLSDDRSLVLAHDSVIKELLQQVEVLQDRLVHLEAWSEAMGEGPSHPRRHDGEGAAGAALDASDVAATDLVPASGRGSTAPTEARLIGSWTTRIGPESVFAWSPEACAICGIEPGVAIRNFDFYKLVDPVDRDALVEAVISARSGCGPIGLEVGYTRPDGVSRRLLITTEAQLDGSGTVIGVSGTVEDVTTPNGTASVPGGV